MRKYLIKSNYEHKIEANSEEEAIEKWNKNIEDELGTQNQTFGNEFAESLYAKKIDDKDNDERDYDYDDAIAGADAIFDMVKNQNPKQIHIILEELEALRLGLQEIAERIN